MTESIIKPSVERGYYLLGSSLASHALENIRTLWMTQRCIEEPVPLRKYRNHDQNAWVTSILTLAQFGSIW